MKITAISCFALLISFTGFGQDDDTIILTSGDTLIAKIKTVTEEFIQYKSDNVTSIQKPNDIDRFWFNNSYYKSEQLSSGEKAFVNYRILGPLSLGTFKTFKKVIYYIRTKQDVHRLTVSNIDEKISSIDNYEEFREQYNSSIVLDYKSLGNMTSAYNAFVDPETYEVAKYKNPPTINVSFDGSIGRLSIKNDDENYSGISTTIGFGIWGELSDRLSINSDFLLYAARAQISDNRMLNHNAFIFIPSILVKVHQNERSQLFISGGVGSQLFINGEIEVPNLPAIDFSLFQHIYKIAVIKDFSRYQVYASATYSNMETVLDEVGAILYPYGDERFGVLNLSLGIKYKLISEF